ncbi:MAG: hypothetical protein ACUVT6_09930 [Thermodesulfobacteriota bacterium]
MSFLYGYLVTADSYSLFTGVTELAHPKELGKTMALQSFLGWTGASISPIAFGYILDFTNPLDVLKTYGYIPPWGWAFMILGLGSFRFVSSLEIEKRKFKSLFIEGVKV